MSITCIAAAFLHEILDIRMGGGTMYLNQNFLLYKTGYLVTPYNSSSIELLGRLSTPQILAFLAVFGT